MDLVYSSFLQSTNKVPDAGTMFFITVHTFYVFRLGPDIGCVFRLILMTSTTQIAFREEPDGIG